MSVMQGSCRVGLPIAAFCPGQTASSRQLWNGTDEDADDGAPTSAPVRFETLILMATITKAISGSGQYRNGAAAMPSVITPRRASRRGLPGNMGGQLSIWPSTYSFRAGRTPGRLAPALLVWFEDRLLRSSSRNLVGGQARRPVADFLLVAGLQTKSAKRGASGVPASKPGLLRGRRGRVGK